ncbi:MAG TPA: hypothetical protein VL992_03530 [Tepidisphaeraceae bacterium]|nr:hypothetical protein [Tepidisphaeraceae bacterium]
MAETNMAKSGSSSAMVRPGEHLPTEQREAMEALLKGCSISAAAQASGVTRQTVHNWLKKNPAFQAVYNQWQAEVKESCRNRLLMLSDKAASTLERALEEGDARSALQLLKAIGLMSPVADKPTDEADVRKDAEIEALEKKAEREIAEVRLRTMKAAALEEERMWRGK